MPLPDPLVAIGVAAERLLGVVEVQDAQAVAPDLAVELRPGRGVPFRRADIVPGDEDVAGIEADADAIEERGRGQFEQAGEVRMAARSVPGGDHSGNSRRRMPGKAISTS